MTLALTGDCNLRCRYCYQNVKSGVRMPWPTLETAVDRLLESPAGRVELVFAGGEPLLAFGLIERAVRYVEVRRPPGLDVRYSLATNGTLLRPGVIAFLDAHGFEIELSFDGVRPAQSLRGARSFGHIDQALDRLCADAPAIFWHRLTVGVTLDADAVPHLAESFSYFLDKRLPSISISPATGQNARWTPSVLDRLDHELKSVYRISRRHYRDTGQVPLVPFRKTSNDHLAEREVVCGAATPGSVTVDVDGETYACPMLAESSQRFANERLAAGIRPMRTGNISGSDFWNRLAGLPVRARESGIFQIGPDRHSLHGRCIQCRYHLECKACPLAVIAEPDHDDAQRVPDYVCAFNWTLLDLRGRFPVQPDDSTLLAGRAPRPRLVRELLRQVGSD